MGKNQLPDRRFYSQAEVAAILGVSQSTVKAWREMGMFPYFQIPGSRRVLYPKEAIDSFLTFYVKQNKEVVKTREIKREWPRKSINPPKEWRV